MVDVEVVDLGPTDHLEAGDRAPDFTRPLVTDEFWEDRALGDVVADEGTTVLVFTPMIGSFAGKYVFDELADRDWFDRAGRVVGVTASTPYGVSRFLDENDLPIGIFADPANDVADAFGIVHDLDGMAGITEPRLTIVGLEPDLTIDETWVAREWPEFPDYDALEERLGLEN